MIYAINFIQSSDIDAAKNRLETLSNSFAENPGIHSVNLYKVSGSVKEETPIDFQIVRIIECENKEAYENAKIHVEHNKDDNEIFNIDKENFCDTLISSDRKLQLDTPKTLLINPIRIKEDQMEAFLDHYKNASKTVVEKPGFIAVNFLKALDPAASTAKFINIAEWESEAHIKNIIGDKQNYGEHRQVAQQFVMAPALCQLISTTMEKMNNFRL